MRYWRCQMNSTWWSMAHFDRYSRTVIWRHYYFFWRLESINTLYFNQTRLCSIEKWKTIRIQLTIFYIEDSKACSEITYDPAVHRETWQNDNSFVLGVYTRRKRKCRGCELQFMQPASKFVIRHEERNHGSNQNVYYHCNPSCIKPLHPYFKACEVTATSTLARNLTVEDVKRIRRYDIELAFVHKVWKYLAFRAHDAAKLIETLEFVGF